LPAPLTGWSGVSDPLRHRYVWMERSSSPPTCPGHLRQVSGASLITTLMRRTTWLLSQPSGVRFPVTPIALELGTGATMNRSSTDLASPITGAKLFDQRQRVALCTESFGLDAVDGRDGFCRLLAGRGRFLIRYDHRDTDRSTTYEPGPPGYAGADLLADAVAVLEAEEAATPLLQPGTYLEPSALRTLRDRPKRPHRDRTGGRALRDDGPPLARGEDTRASTGVRSGEVRGASRRTIYSIGISKRAMMPGSPPLASSSGSGSRVATQAYPCSG
jgi:hypothetical protein